MNNQPTSKQVNKANLPLFGEFNQVLVHTPITGTIQDEELASLIVEASKLHGIQKLITHIRHL